MKQLADYRSTLLSPVHAAYRELARRVEQRFHAIDSAEGHMLSYITRYGPCPVGRIAEVFGTKGATLTGQLDRLEQRGLVQRQLNPDDRRSFLVGPTLKGRKIVRDIGKALRDIESELMAQISPADHEAFLRVVEIIRGVVPAKGHHV